MRRYLWPFLFRNLDFGGMFSGAERSDEHGHVKENLTMGVPLLIMSCMAMCEHRIFVEALGR